MVAKIALICSHYQNYGGGGFGGYEGQYGDYSDGGNYGEGDGDGGDYSEGNIAQMTGLTGHSATSYVEPHSRVYIVE